MGNEWDESADKETLETLTVAKKEIAHLKQQLQESSENNQGIAETADHENSFNREIIKQGQSRIEELNKKVLQIQQENQALIVSNTANELLIARLRENMHRISSENKEQKTYNSTQDSTVNELLAQIALKNANIGTLERRVQAAEEENIQLAKGNQSNLVRPIGPSEHELEQRYQEKIRYLEEENQTLKEEILKLNQMPVPVNPPAYELNLADEIELTKHRKPLAENVALQRQISQLTMSNNAAPSTSIDPKQLNPTANIEAQQALKRSLQEVKGPKITAEEYITNFKAKFTKEGKIETNSAGIKQMIREMDRINALQKITDNKKLEKIATAVHDIAKNLEDSWWSKSKIIGKGRADDINAFYKTVANNASISALISASETLGITTSSTQQRQSEDQTKPIHQ